MTVISKPSVGLLIGFNLSQTAVLLLLLATALGLIVTLEKASENALKRNLPRSTFSISGGIKEHLANFPVKREEKSLVQVPERLSRLRSL